MAFQSKSWQLSIAEEGAKTLVVGCHCLNYSKLFRWYGNFFFRSLTSCLLLLNFWTLLLSALNLHDFATKKLDSWETQFKCGLKVWRRKTKNEKREGFYSEFLNHSERIGFRHVITFVETWFKRQRGSFNGKRGTLGTLHTKYYFSCKICNAWMIFESLELDNVVEQIQFIF